MLMASFPHLLTFQHVVYHKEVLVAQSCGSYSPETSLMSFMNMKLKDMTCTEAVQSSITDRKISKVVNQMGVVCWWAMWTMGLTAMVRLTQ